MDYLKPNSKVSTQYLLIQLIARCLNMRYFETR